MKHIDCEDKKILSDLKKLSILNPVWEKGLENGHKLRRYENFC